MEEQLDPEIEALLQKYAGGRIPPLVDMRKPESGLVNAELMQIFHRGVASTHSIPLGFLLPTREHLSEERWWKGDYELNKWSTPNWTSFCTTLRGTKGSDEACEECDRRRAIMAERAGGVVAYLCDNGLVDFAVPVTVKGKVIAILLCGQYKPKAGPIWNSQFIEHDGFFRPLGPGEKGVDVQAESERRIREIEQRAGLPEGSLFRCLSEGKNSPTEISPDGVDEAMQVLKSTGSHLSDLATSTYELEKGKVVEQIRNYMVRSLVPLSTTPAETSGVWRRLKFGLGYMTRYFNLDYALILSLCDQPTEGVKVLCQFGLPEGGFPMKEMSAVTPASISTLRSMTHRLGGPTPVVLRDYKSLPFLDRLYRLHTKKSKRVLVVPIMPPVSGISLMVLGRFKRETELSTFTSEDREALGHTVEGITLVTEIALLVEQLETTARRRELFVEDVAHNIRTPIQNIIIEAEALVRSSGLPEEVNRRTRRLAAQARRLHLTSQRVWTLMSIEGEGFKPDDTELVNVYQTLMERRKALLDLAGARNIEILVDRELEVWPPIEVNKTLFSEAIFNLIDNAVKYSREATEIRIDGKRLPDGVALSFVNKGIPIREEEKDKIFERYYRSNEARKYIPAGTGIGLSIVKAFVEHCRGNVETKSVPIPSTRDYVTEFRIFIPHRR